MDITSKITPAALAMRLRQVTQLPITQCMEFLVHLGQAERERYVKHYEARGGSLLIDPVELDPVAAPRIASIREEAAALAESGRFGSGMGKGHRISHWVQQELVQRYGIAWRTPGQMNPKVALD